MKHVENEFENASEDLTRVQQWPRPPRSNPIVVGAVIVIMTLAVGLTAVAVLAGAW